MLWVRDNCSLSRQTGYSMKEIESRADRRICLEPCTRGCHHAKEKQQKISPMSHSFSPEKNAPWIDQFSGVFTDRRLERQFLGECEKLFIQRDRKIALLMIGLELVLIFIDIGLLHKNPAFAFLRVGLRSIFIATLLFVAMKLFRETSLSPWGQMFCLLTLLIHNAIIATYHHPVLQDHLSPGYLLAVYLFTITAYYTAMSLRLSGVLTISAALVFQFIFLQLWTGFGSDNLLIFYAPFLLGGLIAFSHYTAVGQSRLHRLAWLNARNACYEHQRAEEAQQFRTRLLEVVGHDLRQPLNAMRYYLTALQYEPRPPGPDRRDEPRQIVRQLTLVHRQIADILDKTLDLAQLDNEAVTARCYKQPASPMLRELLAGFSHQTQKIGIRLRVYGWERSLYHDPDLMAAVLRNLVANALQYHAFVTPRPRVVIAVRAAGRRIDVVDNGGGMRNPLDGMAGESPASGRALLSGRRRLGLDIARQMAQKQGWKMVLNTAPGKGVHVILTCQHEVALRGEY